MEEQWIMFGDIFSKIKQSRFVQKWLEIFFQRKIQQWIQKDIVSQQKLFFFDYVEGLQETTYREKYGFNLDVIEHFEDIYNQWKLSIPLRNHDTLWEYMKTAWWTWLEWTLKKRRYALSGGTTQIGWKNKKRIYIPYCIDSLNQSAFQTITAHCIHHFWYESLFSTNFFPLWWSIREETDKYIAGDVSAILIQSQNSIIAKTIYPYSIETLTHNWDKKYFLFMETIHERNVGSIMGTTKRIAQMLDEIYKKYPHHREELKKTLSCVLRGWVDIEPYKHIFEKLEIKNLMGIYNAAEGIIGFQDLKIKEDVWYQFLETGFFEFIPKSAIKDADIDNPHLPCFWIWTITQEIFNRYWNDFLLIYSTPWQVRSPMDVIHLEFFDDQLRFQIVWRIWWFINLVGEELLEIHAKSAIQHLWEKLWVTISQWTVAPSNDDTMQSHEWIIEYWWDVSWETITNILDEWLQTINGDYADKRQVGWLWLPKVHIIPLWAFDAFHASQGKVGGQTKTLIMCSKREYIGGILDFYRKKHD